MIPLAWGYLCSIGLVLVTPVSPLQISQAIETEVCSHETYSSQCQYDEILVITKAIYGHIRQGRCAIRDVGHFGCFTDVTSYMESQCLSQRSCIVTMTDVIETVETEVCAHEDYTSQCQYDEILVITKAIYGHIRQGRCAIRDFGHFGCFTDVTSYMESQCLSQRSCIVTMTDVIESQPLKDVCVTMAAVASEKFFFSKQAMQEHCPSPGYVTLEAKPGQQVKVNIIIPASNNDHQEIGGVVEDGIEHAYEISTNTDGRLEGQYTSKTNSVTLVIGEAPHSHIIVFQGTGCADIKSPHNSFIERDGDTLVVRCRYTEQVWNLKCIGTRWIGAVGTCNTPTELPPIAEISNDNEYEDAHDKTDEIEVISKELIIGIIISATFVLCCLVFAFGYLCTKGMKRKYLPNKDYEKCEMVAVDGTIARMLKTDNVQTWQNTMNPTMIRNDHMPVVAQDRDFITVNTNNL
ncbi:hypothetical protein CAPTEDRAFT_211543 [Capitella teleta]|uniref:SUEL-type lectin domain-containing protein n=1 Tax=Capitella teleta TaxID=283909 RepID=R7THY4_CAPTE|nr:hypothetical protein CAPTEDRAFT_211543 [Capitella teleta]|eukprot:ELT90705.1 hypothetical protein CAPTEDRAFT_211543 [Capitella teleta]